MLILWGFLGIILFGMYKKSIYDYYLAFLFPLPFLLVGAVTSVLLSSRKYPIYKIFGIVIISLSVVSAILFSPLRVNPNNQYKQVKTVSEFILSKTTNKPFNFALLSQGNSDYAYRFIFRYEGHQATVLETPLTDPDRLTVADQLLVLCDYRGCNPLGDPLWEVAGFGQSRIVGEWETSVGKLYKLVHDGSNESTKK